MRCLEDEYQPSISAEEMFRDDCPYKEVVVGFSVYWKHGGVWVRDDSLSSRVKHLPRCSNPDVFLRNRAFR